MFPLKSGCLYFAVYTFQVLNNPVWLVDVVLDSAALDTLMLEYS